MSVQFSKSAIISKNKIAIEACNQSISRLNSMAGLSPDKEAKRIARLGQAQNEKTLLRTINAYFTAAGTTVKPIDDAVADELNALANSLDNKIQNNLIINATLDFVTEVLQDVEQLKTITGNHQG